MGCVVELILGFAFGFVLHKAGLGEYHRIVGQFRLRDFTMAKFMCAAIASGAVGAAVLNALGLLDGSTMPAGGMGAALLGGAVLGAGMALCGMCPGTIAAGIGRGSLDYLVPGLLGVLAGSIAFGMLYEPVVIPLLLHDWYVEADLGVLAGVSAPMVVAVIVAGVGLWWAAGRIVGLARTRGGKAGGRDGRA